MIDHNIKMEIDTTHDAGQAKQFSNSTAAMHYALYRKMDSTNWNIVSGEVKHTVTNIHIA